MMQFSEIALLFVAAILGGAVNSIAGGGSLVTFPMLILTGLSPIVANATNNLSMCVGTIGSISGYYQQIKPHREIVMRLAWVSFAGSLIGAILLLTTPAALFYRMVPFLILLAAVLFSAGPSLVRRFRHTEATVVLSRWSLLGQFVIAIYAGYFGAGQGIATLALLTLIGMNQMHEMNGVKSFLSACTNGIAIIPFVIVGVIAWPQALLMSMGAILGGFIGARLAKRVDPEKVRTVVLIFSYGMVGYFFWKVYLTPHQG